ncbi:hypothetical protein V9T40_003848 [Parthenolecanium corni]|uniref:G patch domain-containing protein 4 n=1 Tax=Parthenolecanium corni TaxID=536013 RepID=A0AAN9TRD7_9HEMI
MIIITKIEFEINIASLGKGLGRDESGDPKPLKCNLKFDKAGIGYNEKVSQETTNRWWVQKYNEAASKKTKSSEKSKSNSSVEKIQMEFNNLTDEELFAACGGRTAHKAARHGLKLNGKLERIRKQEILATSACQATEANEDVSVADATSLKKSKKIEEAVSTRVEEVDVQTVDQSKQLSAASSENYLSRTKRKKKAKVEEDHADDTCAQEFADCQQIIAKKRKTKKKNSNTSYRLGNLKRPTYAPVPELSSTCNVNQNFVPFTSAAASTITSPETFAAPAAATISSLSQPS